jgi:uncharacterized membrane protein YhaH (DUF805 family)
MNWYIRVLKKYAVFSGRARRKEYWMFALFNFIFSLVASLLQLAIFGIALWGFSPLSIVYGVIGGFIIPVVYAIAVFVPGLAVSVRRLHDIGKSGWYLLIVLIPIAGPIWFLVLMCLDSQPGDNKYGPNPKGESGTSIADYDKAIKLAPDSADAYYNRGDAYDEMGKYHKAIADYNKAIKLDPNHALAYYNRGCAHGEIGLYDKAIADYNKFIELNPNDSLAYYNRGLAYREKGEVPKVVSDLEKCISLSTDPELTKDAQQAMSEMKHSP